MGIFILSKKKNKKQKKYSEQQKWLWKYNFRLGKLYSIYHLKSGIMWHIIKMALLYRTQQLFDSTVADKWHLARHIKAWRTQPTENKAQFSASLNSGIQEKMNMLIKSLLSFVNI